jgi:hypothetical protein
VDCYRGCAVRPLSELPDPLEDPPPDDEPLSGDGLPPLDCVAPDDVIVPRPADEPRELDPFGLFPLSDLVVASRVRTRVYPTPFTTRPPPSADASPSSFVTTLAPG